MSSAVAVALLVAGGVYLLLQRGLLRVTLGFVLLGHAANLVLLAAGGTFRRDAPLLGSGDAAGAADPLPQAFVLTAIVITFGITVYLLALAGSGGDDDTPAVDGHGDDTVATDRSPAAGGADETAAEDSEAHR